VNVSGIHTVATNNSALLGGFAYVKGNNSFLNMLTHFPLAGNKAYYGSALYLASFASTTVRNLHIRGN
tara:strand:- start:299 stop:502 length:204 start_codon:yes stop_codon:yes gene_type:complete